LGWIMKLLAAAGIVAGTLLLITGAASAACPAGPGDSPVISVPKGMGVRVMVMTPGTQYNYLEICTRQGSAGDWRMEFGEYPNHSDWFFEWMQYAQPTDWQLDFSEASVDPSYVKTPWTGMRRTTTPTGFTLSWYGAAGPDKPNTIVEVCLYASNIGECPAHH
jgi:hypothetical protein